MGFSLLTFEQVLKRYKVLSGLQEKDPDVQLLNKILVMEKSKKKTSDLVHSYKEIFS